MVYNISHVSIEMLALLSVFSVFKVICTQSYPSSIFVPSNAITTDVSFTCSGSPPIDWQVNGTLFEANFLSHPGVSVLPNGVGGLTLTVQRESVLNYNGSSIQCSTNGNNFSSVPTAFIIVYGKRLNNYIIQNSNEYLLHVLLL